MSVARPAMVAGLILLGWSSWVQAQEDLVVGRFDTEDEVIQWTRWWGGAPQLYEFDSSVDAGGSAGSGSLKATVDFDLATYGGDNQFALQGAFPDGSPIDGTLYTNLVFRVRWSSESPLNAGGDFGNLEYGLRNSDWSQTGLGSRTLQSGDADQWVEIRAPIDPATPKLESITGVWLKVWSGGDGGLTGSSVFWVDDVILLANTNTAPPPPPSLALSAATPGLRMAASAAGVQYQRQSVRTQAADADGNPNAYSWVGSASPVTYAIDVRALPDRDHSGFQTHIFLIPEAGMPYGPGDTSIDWNAPHVIFFDIVNGADGTATGTFRYKTNQPSGNSMIFNADPEAGPAGTLAGLTEPTPVGTWSITFRNSTEVTVTGPSGASTNAVLPAAAADLFADPLYAYFGVQPNQVSNIGQSATLGSIRITGVPVPLEETFSGDTIDAAKWAVVAADATGIVLAPPTAKYWLSWAAPATGFVVQSSPSLLPGSWIDPGVNESIVQIGGQRTVLIPASALPGTGAGYFRLIKP